MAHIEILRPALNNDRRDHLQLGVAGSPVHVAPRAAPLTFAHLILRVPSQGERVLAEFTAKSGNFLNVVQRILKNLPPHDNEVTYQYGE